MTDILSDKLFPAGILGYLFRKADELPEPFTDEISDCTYHLTKALEIQSKTTNYVIDSLAILNDYVKTLNTETAPLFFEALSKVVEMDILNFKGDNLEKYLFSGYEPNEINSFAVQHAVWYGYGLREKLADLVEARTVIDSKTGLIPIEGMDEAQQELFNSYTSCLVNHWRESGVSKVTTSPSGSPPSLTEMLQ